MNLKINFIITAILVSANCNAQIGVETTVIEGSGLIDFPTGTTRGVILPQVANNANMTDVSPGTFVFDGTSSRTKYYDGTNWIELTGQTGVSKTLLAGNEQNRSAGVILGDPASTARGVLVFEAPDKAMILPKVINPELNVKSPSAGMICYDPVAKLVCFYNGVSWAFWGNID